MELSVEESKSIEGKLHVTMTEASKFLKNVKNNRSPVHPVSMPIFTKCVWNKLGFGWLY